MTYSSLPKGHQHKGIKPVNKIIQVDDIYDDLRNGLWNIIRS